ncbi:hypothetical protein EVAR_8489_1 [Eumeta japonica]|uniref:Uncharacterized protein n=1 Tax=Eumeta variegata TaxID=151549 RepID=A0A4C1XLY4_EUMVA|nr:hypothetical protein EVAR_8489_1 [Eumeta japonica]
MSAKCIDDMSFVDMVRNELKFEYGRRKMKVGSIGRSMRWKCDLCIVCGVSMKHRCRSSDVKKRRVLKEDVLTRVGKAMLRWFRHRLIKQIYRANECDGKSARVVLDNPVWTKSVAY